MDMEAAIVEQTEEITTEPEVLQKPIRRKRRWWIGLLVLCVLAAAGFAAVKFGVPAFQYARAQTAMEQGDYAEAYRQFRALGDYKDAKILAAEAKNWRDYQKAERLFAEGDYLYARDAFAALGSFRDAADRAEEAARYERSKQQFWMAESCFAYGDVVAAYETLAQLEVPDFPGAPELMATISDLLYQLCLGPLEDGNRMKGLVWLEYLESIEHPQAQTLRERVSGPLELDTGYYDSLTVIQPLDSFNRHTTAEEFARTYLDMFFTGDIRRTLPARNDARPYTEREIDILRNNLWLGYELADERLPEYGSIYLGRIDWAWNGERFLSVTLQTHGGRPYTQEEFRAHRETVDAFCRESVLALNAAGLLDASMSYKERARVIYDWVCYYLTYDDTLEIHDAGVAIEEGTGVCESYVALYNRMCNLAGVPTYSQIGKTTSDTDGSGHVWTIQLDEEGNLFYTDATWGDNIVVPFRDGAAKGAGVEDFLDCYAVCSMPELSGRGEETLREQGDFSGWFWTKDRYFWQAEIWDSHTGTRDAREIVERFTEN